MQGTVFFKKKENILFCCLFLSSSFSYIFRPRAGTNIPNAISSFSEDPPPPPPKREKDEDRMDTSLFRVSSNLADFVPKSRKGFVFSLSHFLKIAILHFVSQFFFADLPSTQTQMMLRAPIHSIHFNPLILHSDRNI